MHNGERPRTNSSERPAKPRQTANRNTSGSARRRAARAGNPPTPAAQSATVADDSNGPNNNNSGPRLQQVPGVGKTGTRLADLPSSVQIIVREVLTEQGTTTLKDAVANASGINTGGQDSLGYRE